MSKNRIKEVRKSRGLTLQSLADMIGTDKSQINRLERGERRLTTEWLERLAGALGCTPADLLANNKAPKPISEALHHTLRGFVFDALQKTNWTVDELAKQSNVPLHKLEGLVYNIEGTQTLTDAEMWRIAERAEIAPLEAITTATELEQRDEEESDRRTPSSAKLNRIPSPPFGEKDLPVFGTPNISEKIGSEGLLIDFNRPVEFVTRPYNLFSVENGYAVFVNGFSMSPRYHHGELLYVNPTRPAKPEDYVLIKLKNRHEAIIRRLVRFDEKIILVSTHNPHKEESYKTDEIEMLDLIIGCISHG